MKKIQGQLLAQYLQENKPGLATAMRLRLSLALLRALKEQVIDKKIGHTDIAAKNIIVNPDTMKIDIIDFGEAIISPDSIAKNVYHRFFRPKQISASNQRRDDLNDIVMLLKRITSDPAPQNDVNEFDSDSEFEDEPFEEATNETKMDLGAKRKFDAAVSNVGKSSYNNESIVKLIDDIYKIFVSSNYPDVNPDRLLNIYKKGASARKTLETSDEGTFFTKLNELTADLKNDVEVAEFIHGLGWYSLSGITTSAELTSKARSILFEFGDNLHRYEELLNRANQINQSELDAGSVIITDLNEFIIDLKRKVDKFYDTPFDLDLINNSNENLSKNFTIWDQKLTDISALQEQASLGANAKDGQYSP